MADSRSETSEEAGEAVAMSWANTSIDGSVPMRLRFSTPSRRRDARDRQSGRFVNPQPAKICDKSLLHGGDRKAVRERVSSPTSQSEVKLSGFRYYRFLFLKLCERGETEVRSWNYP
jgi:hypothetical protein